MFVPCHTDVLYHIMSMLSVLAESCPYGVQSELKNFPDRFDIDSPKGVNPNAVLSGKPVFIKDGDKIIFDINRPVFVMDLQYTSTGRTMVMISFANKPTETQNVS